METEKLVLLAAAALGYWFYKRKGGQPSAQMMPTWGPPAESGGVVQAPGADRVALTVGLNPSDALNALNASGQLPPSAMKTSITDLGPAGPGGTGAPSQANWHWYQVTYRL